MYTVTNDEGRVFGVRVVGIGDRYGRDNCLTYPKGAFEEKRAAAGDVVIEFYDKTYTANFGPEGQFVSRYYLSTLAESENARHGLALDCGVPAWSISAMNRAAAVGYAYGVIEGKQRASVRLRDLASVGE